MGKTAKKTDQVHANGSGHPASQRDMAPGLDSAAKLQDSRELLRLCMFLVQQPPAGMNRIQGLLVRCNIQFGVHDTFSAGVRRRQGMCAGALPGQIRESVQLELVTFDIARIQIAEVEKQLPTSMQVPAFTARKKQPPDSTNDRSGGLTGERRNDPRNELWFAKDNPDIL
jgi:hypothetical protein